MKRIAIVGGGMAGLSAAFYLEKARRAGAKLSYKIFEQSGRPGGALLTEKVQGCIVEGGADSFLTEKPWVIELCRELGIEDQLIGSNDEHRETFIVRKQKLIPLPRGMVFFVPTDAGAIDKSALFSARGKKQILRETQLKPAAAIAGDVSVGDFVQRHFGSEMMERVADPLLAGIYGGDASKLSMRAVLPRFLEMERQSGSLMRGLSDSVSRVKSTPRPVFTSLRNGMQQLVRALTAQLQVNALLTNSEVVDLEFRGARWMLVCQGETHEFDAVVLASPAHITARLLDPISAKMAGLLRKIPYSSSATVALGYDMGPKEASKLRALKGFGFLVPFKERHRALACTFVHNKFPNRVDADRALLRVFFGGMRDEAVLRLKDKELVRLARAELKSLVKVELEPLFWRIHRWPRVMPQYNIGHGELMRQIQTEVSQLANLALAGSAYGGIGVPDCVRQGKEAALQLAEIGEDCASGT